MLVNIQGWAKILILWWINLSVYLSNMLHDLKLFKIQAFKTTTYICNYLKLKTFRLKADLKHWPLIMKSNRLTVLMVCFNFLIVWVDKSESSFVNFQSNQQTGISKMKKVKLRLQRFPFCANKPGARNYIRKDNQSDVSLHILSTVCFMHVQSLYV